MHRELPQRKKIRLQGYDYSQAGCYFVTLCVKDRQEMFGKVVGATALGRPFVELTPLGICVNETIQIANKDGVKIDKYVIMPNHVHIIVRKIKSYVTKSAGFSPWQKSYHDHIIRSEAEYQKIWRYIDQNPASWQDDCYYTA